MQDLAETLYREQSLMSVQQDIASVQEIFRLQNASELQEAEKKYLPTVDPIVS
jgi:phosphoenolpyruvate phosphomutase